MSYIRWHLYNSNYIYNCVIFRFAILRVGSVKNGRSWVIVRSHSIGCRQKKYFWIYKIIHINSSEGHMNNDSNYHEIYNFKINIIK